VIGEAIMTAGPGLLLVLVAGLALVATLVGIAAVTGAGVLRPLDQAAKKSKLPLQFTLGDFFCLFLLIQLPTGLLHFWLSPLEDPEIWVFDGLAWVCCGLMWWVSVRTLSRAGIRNPWHRGVFLVLVLPVAYFGSIVSAILWPVLCVLAFQDIGRGDLSRVASIGAVQVALLTAVFVCRHFTRRMVAAAEAPAENPFAD
jgi:hypothetical protein